MGNSEGIQGVSALDLDTCSIEGEGVHTVLCFVSERVNT